MAESPEQSEKNLELLGNRVRAGWAKLHPAKQEHRDAVQQALRERLEQQQQQLEKPVQNQTQSQSHAKAEETKTAEQAREAEQQQKRRGHSH